MIEYQKLIKVSKTSQQNNLETVINENNRDVPKESSGKLGCLWQYYYDDPNDNITIWI